MTNTARLTIRCPDRPGIIAAVSSFLHNQGCNITDFDQHATETDAGTFYMRCELSSPDLPTARAALERAFVEVVAEPFEMDWQLRFVRERRRTAILVSRYDHAMLELLWLWSRGELDTDVAMVISNHEDLRSAVEGFGVPFHHVPNGRDIRSDAEVAMLDLLGDGVDLVVLARYMQILSPGFVDRYESAIINIHHSFLPAFAGAKPYHQAYRRGVKIIGATAHYVTADLDQGPIIEQDVARVDHRMDIKDLVALGRNTERLVLARAVRWHLEDRIITDGNRTVVFRP